jgi:hypothetical protein
LFPQLFTVHVKKKEIAAKLNMFYNAEKLLTVGEVLGEDGVRFKQRGQQIRSILESAYMITPPDSRAEQLVAHWQTRQRANAEGPTTSLVLPGAPEPEYEPRDADRDFSEWWDVFLENPSATLRQECSFCGNQKAKHRTLQTCGSCKKALYCDKDCQKRHWKDEHKMKCNKTEEGSKAKVTHAADLKMEPSRDEDGNGVKKADGGMVTSSKTEDGSAADSEV